MEEKKIGLGDLVKHSTEEGPIMTAAGRDGSLWTCSFWNYNNYKFVSRAFDECEIIVIRKYSATSHG